MRRNRAWIRAVLGFMLVAACLAAAIAPALSMVQAAPRFAPAVAPGNLVISSFRFSGSAGPGDEYVEIFNRSCDDVNAINLSGYQLRASTGSTLGTVIYTFPAGTTIDAGQYYLVGG